MTDQFQADALDAVPIKAAEAAAALEALREPAERAASSIEDAFGRAGESLTRSLARAAADGEITLAELARAVLTAVNAGAGGGSAGGLGEAIAKAVGGLFSGRGPMAVWSPAAAPIWSESAARRCFGPDRAAASSRRRV